MTEKGLLLTSFRDADKSWLVPWEEITKSIRKISKKDLILMNAKM
jgi:hypothetical protein